MGKQKFGALRRPSSRTKSQCQQTQALRVYSRHTQANAIDFLDYVIKSFPFRIREARADNDHEFQAKFHWHVEDLIGAQ